jgi:hypothetical protein
MLCEQKGNTMTWNFRIIRKTRRVKIGKRYKIVHSYDLHEVYYNSKGQPTSYTEKPIDANGYKSIKEMQETLVRMLADTLAHPPLELSKGKLKRRA